MSQQAYLATLKQSLAGLPRDQVDDILSDYRQHFADAMQGGRSAGEVASALGDPRKIALEFKALMHVDAFQKRHSLANFGRMALALVWVACFNLVFLPFMLLAPALLLSLYLSSACTAVGGLALAASGLAGVDQVSFERNGRQAAFVLVDQQDLARVVPQGMAVQVSPYAIAYVDQPLASPGGKTPPDRQARSLVGALYIVAGIALYKLGQKLARVMGSTTRRYLDVNANILRGSRRAPAQAEPPAMVP
jgi:uncharacterized membrane protein